jgi:coenzyme F420-reducing hydrogenase beta subunit
MLHLPECSSVKELKEKAGRHWINGEELFCSSESDIRLEQLVQKKEMEKEGGERCDLCCIMLANKSDVIHLSLVW